jgi:protein-S-isoprenylcysteine O-methyltransferase Ste14
MRSRAASVLGSLLFLVLAPGTVAGIVPWWISRWRVLPPLLGWTWLRVLGALLVLLGLPVLLESFGRFALEGRGTPAPIVPTERLVVRGFYRHVRNPMYVAVASLILGQGLLLGSVAVLQYGLVVLLAFHVFVLAYEEPTLRRSFGADYEAYCAGVRRWLPRLQPWSPVTARVPPGPPR